MDPTLEIHIQKFSAIDPDFVKKVKGKFYVDNLNRGVYCVDDINLCKKVKVRFQKAKFNVRKWQCHNQILCEFMKSLIVSPAVSVEFVKSDINNEITDSGFKHGDISEKIYGIS